MTIRSSAHALGILLLILLPVHAAADDPKEQALFERVLEAHRRGDAQAVARFSTGSDQRDWSVAEGVQTGRDGDAAALAFAKSWEDPDKGALLRYLRRRKGKRHPPEALRAIKEAQAAIRSGQFRAARGLLDGVAFERETVCAIRTLAFRSALLKTEDRPDEAATLLLEASAGAERIGWRARAALYLREAALLLLAERDFSGARRAFERRYNLLRSRGDDDRAASCLANLASACAQQGDLSAAIEQYERAVTALGAIGEKKNAALTRANLGLVYVQLGKFERALTHTERALAELEGVGSVADRAETISSLGNLRLSLGQYERGLAHQKSAAALMRDHIEDLSDPPANDLYALAVVLGNCGNAYLLLERYDEAEHCLVDALKIFGSRLHDSYSVAVALANLAELSLLRGDLVGAAARVRGAISQFEKLGAEVEITIQRIVEARILKARGEQERAIAVLQSTRKTGERLRLYSVVVEAMTEEAELHLALGKTKKARRMAFGAVDILGSSLAHLADSEGADARARRLRTYQLPIRVAVATGDVTDCLEAIDEARAGMFLEAFGGRAALQSVAVPRDIAARLRTAHATEGLSWVALRRAQRHGALVRGREAKRRLDAAQKRTHAAHEALQRTAKHAADLVYPRADTLSEVRAELEPGDALVLYALLAEQSVALVVTRDGAEIKTLPSTREILGAYETLHSSSESYVNAKAAPALAAMLITPLELKKDIRRLLISPDGVLAYVPFALLAPKFSICYVPSGTAFRSLRAAKNLRGKGVIAFGDPAYERQKDARRIALYGGRGRTTLPRLKASGAEAHAIGTIVFTRAEATEANLRDAVEPARLGDRFRALHLAGHGFANAEISQLSCIALAPSGEDDGFLLAREVMAMEIPADLVVLSACESVRGRIVRGEGLQGLVRAFMFAGAPRVLASLWKVDDEATRVFMEKFYKLWNPPKGAGHPAAEALRLAQEYLRTETAWKQPEYWAGWVLWGLPD